MLRAQRLLGAEIAQARQKYLGELAHELRSALTVISGNADMLLMTQPDLEERVQPIITASERIEGILQDLVNAGEDEVEAASGG